MNESTAGLPETSQQTAAAAIRFEAAAALDAQLPALRAKLLRHARLAVRDPSLAEDLAQDTLMAVLQHHAQHRGESTLSTWAISILKHKIADWYRSPASTRMVPAREDDAQLDEAIDALYDADGKYVERVPAWQQPDSEAERRQMLAVLEQCVAGLPKQTGRVFMMREWLGFETVEICERLHVSAENCRMLLHRGRMALRVCMQRKWFGGEPSA